MENVSRCKASNTGKYSDRALQDGPSEPFFKLKAFVQCTFYQEKGKKTEIKNICHLFWEI